MRRQWRVMHDEETMDINGQNKNIVSRVAVSRVAACTRWRCQLTITLLSCNLRRLSCPRFQRQPISRFLGGPSTRPPKVDGGSASPRRGHWGQSRASPQQSNTHITTKHHKSSTIIANFKSIYPKHINWQIYSAQQKQEHHKAKYTTMQYKWHNKQDRRTQTTNSIKKNSHSHNTGN